jgi:uncharacterized protein (DUF983 family)
MRALRLRCPECGKGKLFHNWFTMPKKCSECGLKFEREPGYYLGSIYVNYGLTAVLITIGNLAPFFLYQVDPTLLMYGSLVFLILFPALFFPFARALWLAFDLSWDPPDENSFDRNDSAENGATTGQ